MSPDDIGQQHLSRRAYVYVRQSSLHQVAHNRESQRRQRALVDRALDLGWKRAQVNVIDEDLGESATRTQQRSGFEKLVADVAVGQVGIVFSLDVSRISRGNRNWYHLLDICAITSTLIADGEGIYDPGVYNDRLLLGLKGTMSEAELHLIKQRLVEATRSKAARGEFRYRLPAGYFWDEAGRVQKSADERVRSTIERTFALFEELGSAHRTQCALAAEGLQVPVRGAGGEAIAWRAPSQGYLLRLLKHPFFAGAYVWGRRQAHESLDEQLRPVKSVRDMPRSQWRVLIQDHHEGYIGWEQYERNLRQLESNRSDCPGSGAVREGRSLLQGLVLCGRCGRSMRVNYTNRRRVIRYLCVSDNRQSGREICQSIGAGRVERIIETQLLEALQPVAVEAMVQASTLHVEGTEARLQHARQRLEQARYEVDLARRQYDAVDPGNRLVARELERRWERALEELAGVQASVEAERDSCEKPLSVQEQQDLERFAHGLGELWHAPQTRMQDRKRVVRALIHNVVVKETAGGEQIEAAVHWVGGEVRTITVPKAHTGEHRNTSDPEVVELVRTLAADFADDQIARILHRKRLRTGTGLPFNAQRVTNIRYCYQIPGHTRARLEQENVYTCEQAAEILGVTTNTVRGWIALGLLRGTQATEAAPWRIQLCDEDTARLAPTRAPRGWLPLKGAANALGVTQQTVLNHIKSGKLDAVRVHAGTRTAWRIQIDSTTCDDQPSLFQ